MTNIAPLPLHTPEVHQKMLYAIGLTKAVTMISAICLQIIFFTLPSLAMFCLTTVTTYACYEIFAVSENLQKIVENPVLEREVLSLHQRRNRERIVEIFAKNAPLLGSLLHFIL